MLFDLAIVGMSDDLIVANRAAAGVVEGILYWLLTNMIARSLVAERWSGISMTVMTVVPLLLATVLPLGIMRDYGVHGGYVALAVLALIGVIASLFLPRSLTPLVGPAQEGPPVGALRLRALAVLASAFLFQTCITATWAYLQPLSARAHHPATTISVAVACGLGAQVCGSLLAAVTAHRVPFFRVLGVGFPLVGVSVLVILGLPGPGVFVLTIICFAFLSQFLIPFELSLTISADPTRRAALLMSPVQMLGGSAGPLLASIAMAASGSTKNAAQVSLAALGCAMILALFAYASRPRVAQPVTAA
jgi:hypothetical protein